MKIDFNKRKIMESPKPLSREENIQKYQEQIFAGFSDPIVMVLDYHYLVTRVIKYASSVLDVDFLEKRFEVLPDDTQAVCKFEDKVVKFSKSFLHEPENADEALEKLLNLFMSATHEFTHAFDMLDNSFSQKNRQFLFGVEGLYDFANLFEGQTKKDLTAYAESVYWLARSERLARQGSFTLLERFINKFQNYIENIPHAKQANKQCKKYYDFMNDKNRKKGAIPPPLAISNQEYYKGYATMRKMQEFWNEEMELECKKTKQAYEDYGFLHDKYMSALQSYSEDLVQKEVFDFDSEQDFVNLVWTQMVPETFNPKVLKNFSTYAEKFGLENAQKCCLHLEDFAHQRQQEKQNRKIVQSKNY